MKNATFNEIELLLSEEGEALYEIAKVQREKTLGKEVHIRAILEFSNYCNKNCLYCGLRKNNQVQRYQLSPAMIVSLARQAYRDGYQTIVLQSGEDINIESITNIVQEIKRDTGLAVVLSLGEHSKETYASWKEAGADRYLLKIETTNEEIYHKLRPGCTLDTRLSCLDDLRELGYQVGSGIIVGLPGQKITDLARDILFLAQLDVEMAAIGPLIPHKDTPLGNLPKGSLDLTLKAIAITRLLLPYTHIPATTALKALDNNAQAKALSAGANVLMLSITPKPFKEHYQIYPGKESLGFENAKALIEGLGYEIGRGPGHSPKSRSMGGYTR